MSSLVAIPNQIGEKVPPAAAGAAANRGLWLSLLERLVRDGLPVRLVQPMTSDSEGNVRQLRDPLLLLSS